MKDAAYRAKCIDKILSKHSELEVMEGLADIALDIFQQSLKDENKPLSRDEIKRQIEELNKWNRNRHEKAEGEGKRKVSVRKITGAVEKERMLAKASERL